MNGTQHSNGPDQQNGAMATGARGALNAMPHAR
jgi:hypothetical protein